VVFAKNISDDAMYKWL